jgi:hypothetical protein
MMRIILARIACYARGSHTYMLLGVARFECAAFEQLSSRAGAGLGGAIG